MDHGFQFVVALVIFLTGFGGGAYALVKGRTGADSTLAMRLGAAAAGGVFLGAGLIHMLGDASDIFGVLAPQVEFPLAFTIAALGFVIILGIERVAFQAQSAADGPYAYILALALGFHSLLAGIALGVEDSAAVGFAIAIAIIAHKGAAAFSLAVSFIKGGLSRRRAWGLLLTFSCITPAGILIGRVIGHTLEHESGELVEAVFDALAAGSFLYIAALDIIQEEFTGPESHVPRFIALLAGLGLMTALALYT